MKKIIFLILTLVSITSYSQFCPALGPDQFLPCGVSSATLTADLSQCGPGSNPNQTTNYSVTNIPFVGQPNAGTVVNLSDDSQAGPFNIGFTFCYYGNTYTQFWLGSNGWISFSGGQPNTFTSNAIPTGNALTPKNCIMGPWQDWNPGIGGTVRYQVQGTAPCRKLVVSWINIPMFSCTNLIGTFHIVIYESSNVIENHIQSKPNCPQWAGGTAVQGLHNLAGSAAVTVPGRNSTQWTTQNNAYRYTPSGPVVTPTLTWFQVGNPNPIGTGPTITVNPPPGGANYTCQFVYPVCNAGWASCNAGVGTSPDTVFVSPGPPNLPNPAVVITDPICNSECNGTVTITPNGGTGVITISWAGLGNSFNLANLCAGTYTYDLADAAGCTYNGSVTLVDPPVVPPSPITASDTVCVGSVSETYSVVPTAGYTYQWQTVGNILSGQGTSTITVNWSSAPSGFTPGSVQVTTYNQLGCSSLPTTFDLTIFELFPAITQIGPYCSTDSCANLLAQPLGGFFTIDGVNVTQFCPNTNNSLDDIVYTYTQSGCTFDDTINVIVNPQPFITDMSPDDLFIELCEGDTSNIIYNVTSTFPGSVTWTIDGTITNGNNTIGTTWGTFGTYVISAYITTAEGCVSPEVSTSLTIQECPQVLIFIPNAFTPDGDETNHYWLPVFTSGFDPYEYTAYIFNRWGNIVWESHNHTMPWDGTYNGNSCTEGVYTYIITYGNPKDDGRNTIHGHVTLLR
jgi:gliding motility-associated-like protein